MRRAMILCLFWAMSLNAGLNAGFCATTMFPPLQPIKPIEAKSLGGLGNSGVTSLADPYAQSPYLADSSVSYPKIGEIEQSLYGKKYNSQDIAIRLARIEKSLFSKSFPALSLAQRVDNIIMNFNQINEFPNISKNTLSEIETKVLKKTYGKGDSESRIERLEQQIFGAVQSGDLASRFETLKAAAQDYSANPYTMGYNPNPYTNGYGQMPMQTSKPGLRGVLGNIGNYLMGGGLYGGSMTGFTPPIDPYNNYNYNYNNNNGSNYYANGNPYNSFSNMSSPGSGIYRGYRSNHGYSDSFSNYGSGSRVTILD